MPNAISVPREVSRGQDADKPSRREAGCYSSQGAAGRMESGPFDGRYKPPPSVGEYSPDSDGGGDGFPSSRFRSPPELHQP